MQGLVPFVRLQGRYAYVVCSTVSVKFIFLFIKISLQSPPHHYFAFSNYMRADLSSWIICFSEGHRSHC